MKKLQALIKVLIFAAVSVGSFAFGSYVGSLVTKDRQKRAEPQYIYIQVTDDFEMPDESH